MIVDFLLGLVETVVGFILSLMPPVPLPSALEPGGAFDGFVSTVVNTLDPLAVWVPFAAIAQAAGLVLACVLIALVVRAARLVVSHLTGGGGAL